MKKILIALAATTALTAGMPAAAQYAGGIAQSRSGQLQAQLQAGVRSGAISRAEAMPLRDQLRQLTRLERLYSPNGISGRERADLQHRINMLRQGIRMAERTRDDRYGGDDRYSRGDDGYDRDGRYDRERDGWDDRDANRDGRWDVDARNDTNRDGWDDRDTDRDGRWDDEAGYGRGQAGGDDGVLGQIIDRVTGNGGLRVGQQASADLGAVPYPYRTQYRDGNGAYYRSDGRQIYQIDARTHTVARVYAINR
jgi:hypothetical protein